MKKRYQLRNSCVEAIWYDGNNYDEIASFANGHAYKPFYAEKGVRCFTLNTQFGETRVYPDCYIVHIAGRLYMAVEPEVFHLRYVEVVDDDNKKSQ